MVGDSIIGIPDMRVSMETEKKLASNLMVEVLGSLVLPARIL